VRRRFRNTILLQQATIIVLVIALIILGWEFRKQQRAISVLIDAVYTLQQLEEQRDEQEAAPARSPDVRTF
jgi:hypothetical protein